MARYWWVNHKLTAGRMIEGGYLWSPKHNTRKADNGVINNETYNNMRRVDPDDLIVSFSKKIAFVGRATGFAFTAKMPLALAPLETPWGNSGWLLPVAWAPLQQQIVPRDHIDLLRALLPTKHSPIQQNGDGNQNVFLAEISAELFEVLCGLVGFEPAVVRYAQQIAPTPESMDDEAAQRIVASPGTQNTEAEAVVMARRGQGKFRQNVTKQEGYCRLTGIANSELLIASHIKPWRVCEDGERLDGANGLLLTPNADRLFDRGYITFHDDGEVEVSSRLPANDLGRLGFSEREHIGRRALHVAKPKVFTPPQRQYLEYHRKQVFLPAV